MSGRPFRGGTERSKIFYMTEPRRQIICKGCVFRATLHALIFALAIPALTGTAYAAGRFGVPRFHKIALGVLLHDVGPTSDKHEDGVDPHIELQFAPPKGAVWRMIGSPYPTIGLTPNFSGDTSALYGGLTYEYNFSDHFSAKPFSNLFLAGGIGAAVHDGPLHKDNERCLAYSDCGFGWRVIPHFSAEIGYKIGEDNAVSFFYDHMSHRKILPGENEGVDHIGLRYHFLFSP